VSHWDKVAGDIDTWRRWSRHYHKKLAAIYNFLIPNKQNILEVGCGCGDLLASLSPAHSVGVDYSPEMIKVARQRHPDITFICSDINELEKDEKFDIIIMSDLASELWDVQETLTKIKRFTKPDTRIIFNFYSRLWEAPLSLVKSMKLSTPTLNQNWLTKEDITGICHLSGFEVIRSWQEILLPLPIPVLDSLLNRFFVKLWPFKHGALTNFMMARPSPAESSASAKSTVSVLVPARNEAGNISNILKRTPEMGGGVELIFVEGHSKDDTYETIEREIKNHPERRVKLIRQTGNGKGNAVREGFDIATGDILMILDADLTVPPEDLPRFYDAIVSGKGEFINGVRLIYPMEDEAMRFFNLLGNKFFSLVFSWLLNQPVKDTLCGTKVISRENYNKISSNRAYFGDFDPFGDFDLLFGASKLNLKIIDLPVRYRARSYGETNIQRWKHGWLLVKMAFFAIRRLKFT